MSIKNHVTLNLHGPLPGELATLQGRLFAQSLDILTEMVGADDPALRRETDGPIRQWRAALDGATAITALESAGGACIDAIKKAVASHQAHFADQRREVASLVELVRHAIEAAAGEHASFNSSVSDSFDRFEAASQTDDLRTIKAVLAVEVSRLKDTMKQREQQWESRVGQLNEHIGALEGQLTNSRREAGIDPLTGVPNRRTFDDVLTAALRAPAASVVVAAVDVDAFKSVNDTYGHAVGDQVLMTVSQSLKDNLRDDDTVARIGGDEFVVIARDVTLKQAEIRFRSVVVAVSAATKAVLPGEAAPVSISCGLAEFSAGDSAQSLVERADEALYASKRAGKNRVMVKNAPFIRDLFRR